MNVTFELARQLTFEELCKFVLKMKEDGVKVIEYMFNNSGDNELYLYAADSCEVHEVFIDKEKLTLKQFDYTEALEYYNYVCKCIENTDSE